jgi:hypothetical protein
VHLPGWLSVARQRELPPTSQTSRTDRPQIGLPSGRLNITLRESGLGDSRRVPQRQADHADGE